MTDASLTASNIPETDHAAWSGATAYVIGNRVILTSTHKVYEAIAASTNKNPATDPARDTYWLEVSATNRWRAFDNRIMDQSTRADSITYTITPTIGVNTIAFFNVEAVSIRVEVKNPSSVTTYDSTADLVDASGILDWFDFFTFDGQTYDTEALFTDLPALAGYKVFITISYPGGTAKVGQISLGNSIKLGETLGGTTIGFDDYSRKDRDEFGNVTIIERAFANYIQFQVAIPVGDERRVQREIARYRATPAVYYASPALKSRGTITFGWPSDFNIPLATAAFSFATIEIQGLT